MASLIKWRNKFSGEEGFVKGVSKAQGHFTNTFEAREAKRYASEKALAKDMQTLADIHETDNNDFFTVEVK